MNKNQGIVIVSAGIGLNLIKSARPAWQESGQSALFLGVLDTSDLMILLGVVAAIQGHEAFCRQGMADGGCQQNCQQRALAEPVSAVKDSA